MRTRPLRHLPTTGWDLLAYSLFLAYLLVIAATFRDYGISWDEPVQATYGEYILRWYASGMRDTSALEYLNLKYYGGFFDVLAQSAARLLPLGMYESRHLVNALFGVAAVAGVWRLARYLGGPRAGALAALFLLLTPVFYGHSFNNPKDIPFATLYLLSCYLLVRTIRFFPRIPWGLVVTLGLAIGLALGVRVGGVLLIGYLLAAFALWYLDLRFLRRVAAAESPAFWRSAAVFVPRWAITGAIAYGVMLLWWPWAQVGPVRHPWEALRESSRFPWPGEVRFEGRMVPAQELPWYYLGKWALITLPEFLLLALAAGVLLAVGAGVQMVRQWRERSVGAVASPGRAVNLDRAELHEPQDEHARRGSTPVEHLTLLFCIVFPVAYAAASGAVLYDGLRHFLFVIPPLAVLAALSLARLIESSRRSTAVAVAGAVVLSMAATAVEMVQLHPYQYIYFNRLFGGGLRQAAGTYETEYWGSSYKEGAEWLALSYPAPADGTKWKVASCSYPTSTEYYLPEDRFEYVGSLDFLMLDAPDLFLATTRFDCHRRIPGRILHVIERRGTPILYIVATDGTEPE